MKHDKSDFNYFKITPKHVFSIEDEFFEPLDCCEGDFIFEGQGTYWRLRFSDKLKDSIYCRLSSSLLATFNVGWELLGLSCSPLLDSPFILEPSFPKYGGREK